MEGRPATEEINIQDYWQATKQSWRVWIGIGLVAAVSAGVWSYCIRPTEYRTSASIVAAGELGASSTQITGILAKVPLELPQGVGSEAELCSYILQTRTTREAVVKECNLQEVLGARSPVEAGRRLKRWTRIELERPNIARIEIAVPGHPQVVELLTSGARENAAALAMQVVNSYLLALEKRLGQLQLTAAKRKRIFLHEQKQQVEGDLSTAENELQKWEAQHKVIEVDSTGKLAVQRLMNLEEQREQARVELKAAQQHTRGLRDKLKGQSEMEPASVVHRANPLVDELREKLVSLESKLAVARDVEGKSAQHPEVRKLQRELEAAHHALAQEQQQAMVKASTTEVANPVARKLREDLALEEASIIATEARIEGLGEALHRTEQLMTSLSGETLEYSRLARRIKIKQTVFETLATEYEQALIEEQGAEPVFRVIDEPVAPEYPAGPNAVSDMGLAGAIGVLVGWVWIMAGGLRWKSEEGRGEDSG